MLARPRIDQRDAFGCLRGALLDRHPALAKVLLPSELTVDRFFRMVATGEFAT